ELSGPIDDAAWRLTIRRAPERPRQPSIRSRTTVNFSLQGTPKWRKKQREEAQQMSVKIRLKRFGSKKRPYYRMVVMDSRTARDGKAIEELGFYHPIEAEDKQLVIKEDRVKEWLSNGAEPSDTVRNLLN